MARRPVEPPDPDETLGCLGTIQQLGMAFYAILLLAIMCSGATCAMGSVVSLTLPKDPTASGLMAGSEAGPWRLSQLREMGVVGADETPLVYVDSSAVSDGSSGCAFHEGTVTAWQLNRVTGSIAIAGAQVSDLGRSVVIARGQDQLTCVLTEGDAAAKFARMMSAEAGR